MKRLLIIGGVLIGIAGANLLYQAKQPIVSATPTPVASHPPTRSELLNLTNKERQDHGLPRLVEDPRLDASAQRKADDEAKYHYFGHISPHDGKHGYEYAREAMPECPRVSENIADLTIKNVAVHAIASWMQSPPHRAALLSPDDLAVGFGISGYHIVQHFCVK